MATTHELSGTHTEDDDDDVVERARRLMFHPAPKPAGEFHMSTDEHILARPLLHEQVEKDDDDDDEEDEDKKESRFGVRHEDRDEARHDEEPVTFAESPMVEVPLRDINMPPEEFIEPLPLQPAETASEQDDEDEQPQQPMFSSTRPPIIRPAEQSRVVRPAAETAEPTPETPVAPTAEAVMLAAAEETVESVVEATKETPEALAATPTSSAHPNTQPFTYNIVPPTPNTPPPTPNTGGNNMPPAPPNHGGGGGGGFNGGNFNNVPLPNNPNAQFQYAANAGGNVATRVIERTHTVERASGNAAGSLLVLAGLIWEIGKRRGGDARLEKKIQGLNKRIREQADESRRQKETIIKQERELNTTSLRTTELEKHAVERQRVAEAFGTAETPIVSTPKPPAERPVASTTAERRTPAAPVERAASANSAEAVEEDGAQPKQFELQPDQHIERSAWHNIVVDSRGREVTDAMQYGQGFQQERQREVAPAAPHDTQTAAAHASTPIGVPLPNAFNPSLPAGMTNPALPADERSPYENMYNNPQYMLEAPDDHRVRNGATTLLLWLLVAGLAFAIVSAVRLLF